MLEASNSITLQMLWKLKKKIMNQGICYAMWHSITEYLVPNVSRPLCCLKMLETKYSVMHNHIPEEQTLQKHKNSQIMNC
jgi:hypothetical protein